MINKTVLLIAGLILLSTLSVSLNGYLYMSFSSELREKRFFDANRDEIDLLILRDGSTMEGVILDESNGDAVLKFVSGTTIFKKSELRKIIHNTYNRETKKEAVAT